MAATLRRNGRTLSRVAIGDDGGGRWELILVAAGGAVAAAIAVLKALDRAGGVAFTVMGVVAALLALGLALQTKVLASQPRRRQVWIVGSAVAFAAGLVIVGLVTFDEPAKSESVNPRFLAGLVESGPFVEDLPPPLEFVGLAPANIGDVSAAQKLTAVQVELAESEGSDVGLIVWAHVEVYPSEELARQRWASKKELLGAQFDTGLEDAGDDTVCVSEPAAWTCVANRGLAYSEVTLTPNANFTLPLAIGTTQALLAYADEQALRAS
jgi:hypothetical protein